MGQHKYNPTAIAAKEGKLPPKRPKMSKREVDRLIYQKIDEYLMGKFGRCVHEKVYSPLAR